MSERIFDLEDRLIDFALSTINIAEKLPSTFTGKHIASQLIRSGTSVALNYGEAQAAESAKDFIHKMKVILKELRETNICLKIIFRKPLLDKDDFNDALSENKELIAIFVKSIQTATENTVRK